MVDKVHGVSRKGDFIRRELDFYQVRTTVDITPTGLVNDQSQKAFDFLVQTISTRAQPIILGDVYQTIEVAPVADLPATNLLQSGTNVTVYNVKFAIEHEEAWVNTPVSLEESLDGFFGFVYTFPSTNNNVSVQRWADMNFN